MKRILLVIVAIAAIIAAALVISDMSGQPPLKDVPVSKSKPVANKWEGYTTQDVTIEGQQYTLLVADTPEKQSLGLMNVTELGSYDGMIFTSSDTSIKTFWNKNTLMDLDLYWMNGSTVVGKSKLPSITSSGEIVRVSSPEPVNNVVELPQKK